MAEMRKVLLAEIDEPALPVREAMDDTKLTELAGSMGSIGLVQPIAVKRSGERFEIVAGHRRFCAAMRLGWAEIPAVIYADGELAEGAAMLAENIFREDLTAAEEAIWFAELMERGNLDEAGLCKLVRQNPDYIGDRLRLLRGDQVVFDALRERKLTFGAARELNKCPDQEHRRYLLAQTISAGAPVRLVAQWIAEWKANQAPRPAPMPETVQAAANGDAQEYHFCCELCGGAKDPYNLVAVNLHRHCLEGLRRALERAALEA